MSDEQLEILQLVLREERVAFEGDHYQLDDIAFEPKATGPFPIWVGGEGRAARRRTARYGDAWFPYYVRMTPAELKSRFEEVGQLAEDNGRDPAEIALCCCLPVEVTIEPVPQEADRLRGTPSQLASALAGFEEVGVDHIALQFMVPRYPERVRQIRAFAAEVIGA